MTNFIKIIELKLHNQKNSIAKIHVEKATVFYSEKIKQHRVLKVLTGDEEVVRAFLIDRLVNELDYKPENIEIEKEYSVKAGHGKLAPRIDVLVKDETAILWQRASWPGKRKFSSFPPCGKNTDYKYDLSSMHRAGPD